MEVNQFQEKILLAVSMVNNNKIFKMWSLKSSVLTSVVLLHFKFY